MVLATAKNIQNSGRRRHQPVNVVLISFGSNNNDELNSAIYVLPLMLSWFDTYSALAFQISHAQHMLDQKNEWTKKKTKCGLAHAAKNVNQIFVFSFAAVHLARMVWFIGFCSVAITLFYNTVTRQMMCCFEPTKHDTRTSTNRNRCQIGLLFLVASFISCNSNMLRLRYINYQKKEKILHFKPSFSSVFHFVWVRPYLPYLRMCVGEQILCIQTALNLRIQNSRVPGEYRGRTTYVCGLVVNEREHNSNKINRFRWKISFGHEFRYMVKLG